MLSDHARAVLRSADADVDAFAPAPTFTKSADVPAVYGTMSRRSPRFSRRSPRPSSSAGYRLPTPPRGCWRRASALPTELSEEGAERLGVCGDGRAPVDERGLKSSIRALFNSSETKAAPQDVLLEA